MPFTVTPFTGVWVEILHRILLSFVMAVTPFTGVWVEINGAKSMRGAWVSHLSRVCGLK